MEYYLITFSNTHGAISAQKHLKGRLDFHVMPTLREISGSCGISLKIMNGQPEEIRKHLKSLPFDKTMYQLYLVTPNETGVSLTALD